MPVEGQLRIQLRPVKNSRPFESVSCSQENEHSIARAKDEIGHKHTSDQGQTGLTERDLAHARTPNFGQVPGSFRQQRQVKPSPMHPSLLQYGDLVGSDLGAD